MITYVTCANWAGIDKWVGAAMGAMAARGPEENGKLEAAWPSSKRQASHFDEVVRPRTC